MKTFSGYIIRQVHDFGMETGYFAIIKANEHNMGRDSFSRIKGKQDGAYWNMSILSICRKSKFKLEFK